MRARLWHRASMESVERGLQVARREVGDVEQQMTAELAPAEFAEELVDVGGQARVLGRRKARGVPDLARTDFAETKMRREPRGAVAVGPVAIAGIAGNAAVEERLEAAPAPTASPGCPVVAQAAGPIRPGRLEFPVFELVACEVRHAVQRLRRRQRLWRIAQRLHPPPERREHAQAPVLLVADLARRGQQVAGEAVRGEADLGQRGGDLIFHGPVRRLRDLVPVHRLGADLARQRGDDRRRGSLAQHQRCAPLAQARLQGAQRLRQPPARRAARAAECPALCRRAHK